MPRWLVSLVAPIVVAVASGLALRGLPPAHVTAVGTPSPSASPSPSVPQSPSPSSSPTPSPSPSASPSPSPSPSPSGPSVLSISVRPAAATWGATFTVAGALECFGRFIAGANVQIQRRIGGTFTFDPLAASTTDAQGKYSITTKPSQSADYRAIIPGGTGACGVSTSATARGNVRVGIPTNVAHTPLPRGSLAQFRGVVAPAHPGRKVYLQVLQGSTGRWANATVAALDSSSHFTLTYRRTTAGYLLFRVVFPTQDNDHMWNVGRAVSVTWT